MAFVISLSAANNEELHSYISININSVFQARSEITKFLYQTRSIKKHFKSSLLISNFTLLTLEIQVNPIMMCNVHKAVTAVTVSIATTVT